MTEFKRILIVILFTGAYNFIQHRFNGHQGLPLQDVVISILIAMLVYSCLVLFFGKKKRSNF